MKKEIILGIVGLFSIISLIFRFCVLSTLELDWARSGLDSRIVTVEITIGIIFIIILFALRRYFKKSKFNSAYQIAAVIIILDNVQYFSHIFKRKILDML